MKSKCWLTMVCWALVCLVLGLIQQAGMYHSSQVSGSSHSSQWLDRCREPASGSPTASVVESTQFDRLVPVRSHLWSSRMRGVREILAHPGKKPIGHRRRSEFGGCRSKTEVQNNNEPPCPGKFLTQPTEFEKSGVLQHPLASHRWLQTGRGSRTTRPRHGRGRDLATERDPGAGGGSIAALVGTRECLGRRLAARRAGATFRLWTGRTGPPVR